jgi:uncharacterized membrane protein
LRGARILKVRIATFLAVIGETFWVLPGAIALAGIIAALALVHVDAVEMLPAWLRRSSWLYNGGATGARTLLATVASSTIGVAGTVFSITIAALSLAAGQMGPRLLRNFTEDRGNQFTLGIFLGTFAYALTVLRSVRTQGEGLFIPHISLTVAIALAFVCVGTLIYFVGHMASRINVDTVIDLVSHDLKDAISRLTVEERQPPPPPASFWRNGTVVRDERNGYFLRLDTAELAAWAADNGTVIRLLVRPGDYVFPGTPIALAMPTVEGVGAKIRDTVMLGQQRQSSADLEFAVRHLVEVAVRALSSGINDPNTAMSVLDRLGAALCLLAPLFLPTGVCQKDGRLMLMVPSIDYDGLVDAMLRMIRQNGSGSPEVLIHILHVLTSVASCDQDPTRKATLRRHADLIVGDARRNIVTPADLADVRKAHKAFLAMMQTGPTGYLDALSGT